MSVLNLTSCARVAYYSQSITGQWEIYAKRRHINEILMDEKTSHTLHEKLAPVPEIRQFASEQLKLPNNNSYLTYADLNREYVVWNVFATPQLSLEPVQWCFLIVGCLSYQGFFDKETAMRQANTLRAQDYDVFVGGVSAYSTLGWFDDPILNTMLNKDITYLVKVIFHELAHQKIYIKNDTEFNEAFAESIALAGINKWLTQYHSQDAIDKFTNKQNYENEFVSLVLETRDELEELYDSEMPDQKMQQNKIEILKLMRKKYNQMRSNWNDDTTYDSWFNTELNNAKIAAVATYRHLIPDFMHLLEKTGNDFEDFYKLINKLERCSIIKRRAILDTGDIQFEC
jgi:predicted aminopeptidase